MCAADRGFTWSDEETNLLLQLWGGNDAQSELTGNKRNFVVYEKISETMNKMGYVRTASQCREKIKRMKREYTLTKQKNEKSNGTKKNMRFFDQFEKILIEKQNRSQKNTALKCSQTEMESLFELENSQTNFDEVTERKMRNIAPKIETLEKEAVSSNPWTPDVVLVEEDGASTTINENQTASTSSENDITKSKKRKMSSQMSVFKSVMDSVSWKFVKYQAESDAKILKKIEELESERNAMDERMHKMWLEFEEKRQADVREHELKIVNNFQDIINQFKVNHASK